MSQNDFTIEMTTEMGEAFSKFIQNHNEHMNTEIKEEKSKCVKLALVSVKCAFLILLALFTLMVFIHLIIKSLLNSEEMFNLLQTFVQQGELENNN